MSWFKLAPSIRMAKKLEKTEETNAELKRRYVALTRQYLSSVQDLAHSTRELSEVQTMANWALRVSPTGWAMVRQGKLSLTNRAFDELNREDSVIGPSWHPLAAEDPRGNEGGGRTLSELVLQEAELLLASDAQSRRRRFERGNQVIEVSVERPAIPGADIVHVLARDVSDRIVAETHVAAMQARLLEKDRAWSAGELALGIAHDLGNLVGALRARLSALKADPGQSRADIDALEAIAEGQTALVAKLKALGRPRAEALVSINLLKEVVQPAVQTVDSWLRTRDRDRQISIVVAGSVAELPLVRGLRDELVNVLINLFLNARDAMLARGAIRVSGAMDEGAALLRIEDQGTGIPEEHLQRIFEPFFSTKGDAGIGMGLATAAAVMRRVGGGICARNRPGGGACFELRFVPSEERTS